MDKVAVVSIRVIFTPNVASDCVAMVISVTPQILVFVFWPYLVFVLLLFSPTGALQQKALIE